MNWDIFIGVCLGFALGGMFYERAMERIKRRRQAEKVAAERARAEAFWRANTK